MRQAARNAEGMGINAPASLPLNCGAPFASLHDEQTNLLAHTHTHTHSHNHKHTCIDFVALCDRRAREGRRSCRLSARGKGTPSQRCSKRLTRLRNSATDLRNCRCAFSFSCFLLLSPDTHTAHTRWCTLILCLSLDQNAHADLGDEHQREKGLRQTLEAQVSELTSRVAELQAQQRRDSDANRRLQTHTSSLEEQV